MDLILHQLGGLVLGSVPTILLFLLLLILYRVLVYGPLTRVLEERRLRTEGAIEGADRAMAAAERKAHEYEAKVRAARVEIFHAREQRLARWNRERDRALAEAREAARQRIAEAEAALESEAQRAHEMIENSAEELTRAVLHAVLPPDLAADLAVSGSSR